MSTIDELQRLHEAATRGEWEHGVGWIESEGDHAAMDEDDIKSVVALHNAWPAIHRVLVAARMLMRCPRCIGPCDDPTVHAELAEALRALDDKERRT